MRIVSPADQARFTIAADGSPPSITIRTDGAGPHTWDWTIVWRTYTKRGRATTQDNKWQPGAALADLGGRLTVVATMGTGPRSQRAQIVLLITGTNPAAHDVDAYLAGKPNSGGFGAIISHESHYRHFTAAGEPIRSFDGGYGMCQLTNPVPTYEQCWSWKRNVDAGLALFAEKVRAATVYLSQQGRTYTRDQLTREAVSRWNGGAYHSWDGNAWVRNPDILCDTRTGNIGWDTTSPINAGQNEAQLRQRDMAQYRGGRPCGANWVYSGVCYADAILS